MEVSSTIILLIYCGYFDSFSVEGSSISLTIFGNVFTPFYISNADFLTLGIIIIKNKLI